ncbi:MAG TPA: iron ABC transporter permease [Candidatus Hydrogenedentes bacterium]|nr:iron ABC transporter permease [Candidatus Hydrogenedentota bacterium]
MRRILIVTAIAVAVLVITPWWGIEKLAWNDIKDIHGETAAGLIFWHIRIPRTLTAFCAGSVLATAGMAFQAFFRNPLATPYTLGISSGAAVGAAFSIRLGIPALFVVLPSTAVFGFLGAITCTALLYGLIRLRGGFSVPALLLTGVALSFMLSSILLVLQYSSSLHDSYRLLRWMMGGVGMVGYDTLVIMVPAVAIGVGVLGYLSDELDLLSAGELTAMTRGVDVSRINKILFFTVSMMIGVVVSVCGPIGFVGIMVPHTCRLIFGYRHRMLFPLVALGGGILLTLCDTVARTIMAPAELPVGVITALIGGPFFLFLIITGRTADRVTRG